MEDRRLLALTLFMLFGGADNPNDSFAANDFAFITDFFDGGANFHG